MAKNMSVTAHFVGLPGDELDRRCHKIFEEHDGHVIGAGTLLATSEREVEGSIPEDRVEETQAALRAAGFRVSEARQEVTIEKIWEEGDKGMIVFSDGRVLRKEGNKLIFEDGREVRLGTFDLDE